MLTTPLQMALVTAATANGGEVVKPYLVSRIIDPATQTIVFERTAKSDREPCSHYARESGRSSTRYA